MSDFDSGPSPAGVVFTANNRHPVGCGQPPAIKNTPGSYWGYFENEHGEQVVCSSMTAALMSRSFGWAMQFGPTSIRLLTVWRSV